MRRIFNGTLLLLLLSPVCLSPLCRAQNQTLSDWPSLVAAKKCTEARKLCSEFIYSSDLPGEIDAQKCLANVSLCGDEAVGIQGESGGYKPEAVDEALAHLNRALKLAPQDISIHQARLHVLEISGRYDGMVTALDESCTLYKGSDALTAWLDYFGELMDLHQYQGGLAFMQVLDRHYPNSADVLSYIAAYLTMLGRNDEAIPYLQRSVALAPKDALKTWDLARAYDTANQIALAEKWYKRALPMVREPERLREDFCLYAIFVETKQVDRPRACSLEKKSCDTARQTACSPAPAATTIAPQTQNK
jgi:tetratricopeptide (TPR) repeat protein